MAPARVPTRSQRGRLAPSTLLSIIGNGTIQNTDWEVLGTPPAGSGKWPYVSTDDGDTSLIQRSSTTGPLNSPASQSFTVEQLPDAAARVRPVGGVTAEIAVKASGTATAKIQTMIIVNSVFAFGSVYAVASTTEWLPRTQIHDQAPGAIDWTVALVNSMEVGPNAELPTTGLTQCGYCFVTAIWYPHAVASVFDIVGPFLPIGVVLGELVGAGLSRADVPRLASALARLTHDRVRNLADEYAELWRLLQAWRPVAYCAVGIKTS